jgi:hypothetical protein
LSILHAVLLVLATLAVSALVVVALAGLFADALQRRHR